MKELPSDSPILITGGAGFIGSALVRFLIGETRHKVAVIDKLTYAGNLESLVAVAKDKRFQFFQADICDRDTVTEVFQKVRPASVMHLAAESHVDRSIDGPMDFVTTNMLGTAVMLECARSFYNSLDAEAKNCFRFHHISTDEVYGDLKDTGKLFTERTPYDPSSPYSATKAGSDLLVRAYYRTYGLPTVISNCSNNYGPYHFPEKLIPLIILSALDGRKLPIYGDGGQIRDWLYVDDHARALYRVVNRGRPGESYNIGGHNEKTNLEVVNMICALLDKFSPRADGKSYAGQIEFVADRPGHDRRYAIDAAKLNSELNWRPRETFESGLKKTVEWYLANRYGWCEHVLSGSYRMERLGRAEAETNIKTLPSSALHGRTI